MPAPLWSQQPSCSLLLCEPGAGWGRGGSSCLPRLNTGLYITTNLEIKQRVESFQEHSLHLKLHQDL